MRASASELALALAGSPTWNSHFGTPNPSQTPSLEKFNRALLDISRITVA
jgi:hypothetical protein